MKYNTPTLTLEEDETIKIVKNDIISELTTEGNPRNGLIINLEIKNVGYKMQQNKTSYVQRTMQDRQNQRRH